MTIPQVGPEMDIPVDDFDGKVVYGQKRALQGAIFGVFLLSFCNTANLFGIQCLVM